MIRSLTGSIIDSGENWVVIEVSGVGYLVYTPTAVHSFTNDTVTLHTYLAVRETALDLYGFLTRPELEMFELLLGVTKVGPKSALQILCQATPALLVEAAEKNDGMYLHKLSGIGKKTAENIVSHLHSKLNRLPATGSSSQSDLSVTQTDAIDALIALGYDIQTARETILNLTDKDATVNSLVTKALKEMQ
jgi:Holliday junction DNA helicase RuvA